VRAHAVIPRRAGTFRVEAHDGVETISGGRQERYVIDRGRFDAKVAAKQAA